MTTTTDTDWDVVSPSSRDGIAHVHNSSGTRRRSKRMLPRCRPLYQKCKAFLSRWPPDWQIVRPQVPIELTRRIECHRRVGPESLRTALLVGFLARVRVATTHVIRRWCVRARRSNRTHGYCTQCPEFRSFGKSNLSRDGSSGLGALNGFMLYSLRALSLHGSRAAARTPRHGRRCSLSPPGKKPQCSCGTFTWWAWWPAPPRLTL